MSAALAALTRPRHRLSDARLDDYPPGKAARRYVSQRWRVFPLHEPEEGRCSCRNAECTSPAKHPRTAHGVLDGTTDLGQVRTWWGRWPGANVGIATGDMSGLLVVDVDPPAGWDSLRTLWASVDGKVASDVGFITLTARTPSGGLHFYFAHPGGIRNSAGKLGPGLDVRADGGYVVGPQSRSINEPDGLPGWRFVTGSVPAPCPVWLVERLSQPRATIARPSAPRPAQAAGVAAGTGYGAAALAGEVERVRAATNGQRNHTLNESSFRLGTLVGAGGLDEAEVAWALAEAAAGVGLGAAEAERTIRSGLRAGMASPRRCVA